MTAPRGDLRRRFLAGTPWRGATPVTLADDASFRRYFRVPGDPSAVVMDAPPEREDVRPFMAVTDYLRGLGLSAPEIYAADPETGFLLLEDLGDDRLSGLLAAGKVDETAMYRLAVDILIRIQETAPPAILPVMGASDYAVPAYDMDRLIAEVRLFADWYVPAATGRPVADEALAAYETVWRELLDEVSRSRETLVLRDYHAENLMGLDGRAGLRRLGLLDYQDAVRGHPAYDLVSLLEDARRPVPADLQDAMLDYYLTRRSIADAAGFRRAYAILGAQRNAKIIGIFTRLSRRDGKERYLSLIPHVWRLLAGDLDRLDAPRLTAWLNDNVPPAQRMAPPALQEQE